MKRGVVLFWIISLGFAVATAKPLPRSLNYDEDPLESKGTIHYPYTFWLGRPFYQNDDDGYGSNYNRQPERRPATISFASVGGGWGR